MRATSAAAALLLCLAWPAAQAQPTLTTQNKQGPATAPAPGLAPSSSPSASLTVNATSFTNNAPVQVTVQGVQKPTSADAIAQFFEGESADKVLPRKLFWLNPVPGYLTSGSASVVFNVLNQRQNVQFQFFRNVTKVSGFSNLTYSASSPVVTLTNPNAPLHVHVSIINATAYNVVWVTRDAGAPLVQYGTTSGQYTTNSTGLSSTYNASNLCGGPANSTGYVAPGTFHNATIITKPSTRYYYVAGDATFGFSQEFSFLSAPVTGPNSTVHVIHTADLGHVTNDGADEYDYDWSEDPLNFDPTGTFDRTYDTLTQLIYDNEFQQGASRSTVTAILNDKSQAWDLYTLSGDVSYARGMETMWDDFEDAMEPLGANIPWMLTNGNHERDFPGSGDRYGSTGASIDSGGECNVAYAARHQMPVNHSASYLDQYGRSHPVEWYSYDHGPVHYTVMSTEIDFAPGSPQYQFIVSDLAAVNRTLTPWLVFTGHRPIYTTSSSGGSLASVTTVAKDLRNSLEDVLYQYSVDLTLWGHDHVYERTCPVFREICQTANADGSQSAPIHVVVGNAGYELSWFANPTVPPYWDTVFIEHGYLRCSVNATSYYCEEVSSVTGELLDAWRLTKPNNYTAPTAKARATAIASFNTIYNTNNAIELFGLPGKNYSIFETPVYDALLGANASLITELQSMNQIVTDTVNGAVPEGAPDTMVDVWAVLEPFYILLQQYSAESPAVASAATGITPLLQQVEKVANTYGQSNGLWYESPRAQQGIAPTVMVGSAKTPAPIAAPAPTASVSTAGR